MYFVLLVIIRFKGIPSLFIRYQIRVTSLLLILPKQQCFSVLSVLHFTSNHGGCLFWQNSKVRWQHWPHSFNMFVNFSVIWSMEFVSLSISRANEWTNSFVNSEVKLSRYSVVVLSLKKYLHCVVLPVILVSNALVDNWHFNPALTGKCDDSRLSSILKFSTNYVRLVEQRA